MALFIRHKQPGPLKPTPNPYPSRFQRWRQSLGVTFFLILIVGGSLRFYKPFYVPFHASLFEGTSWAQGMFIRPFQEAHSFLKDAYSFLHMKKEYAHLKVENEALKWQLQTLLPLQHENAVLRENLNVATFEKYSHRVVRILSSPYDGLHHFFLVAAGHKDGLEKNQAVATPEGVVGRIERVGKYISRVLLFNDINSRIPVITASSHQKAILTGDGSFFPILVYIGDIRKVQRGENVLTSGFGGIFPAGLPVGRVEGTANGKIKIRPYISFQKLEWVHVLQMKSNDFLEELNSVWEEE